MHVTDDCGLKTANTITVEMHAYKWLNNLSGKHMNGDLKDINAQLSFFVTVNIQCTTKKPCGFTMWKTLIKKSLGVEIIQKSWYRISNRTVSILVKCTR